MVGAVNLSDLRPCAICRGPLGVTFYRVTVEHHVINQTAVRNRMAMDTMFPGAPGLASVFDAHGDEGTKAFAERAVILCADCACKSPVAALMEDPRGAL